MASKAELGVKQAAAAKAGERMLFALLEYEPCRNLTIADVKFISEWARTCAFDAINEATGETRT